MAVHEQSSSHRQWSRRRLVASVAVAVVLAGVVGLVVLLVLRARSESAIASLGGPSASVTASGLQLTIAVPPGPYFLSELLEVRMTLANHSQTTYQVQGEPRPSYCFPALWDEQSGGGPPTYDWPTLPDFTCAGRDSTLAPGQHWSILQYEPVSASGRVTLTAHAMFSTLVSSAPGGTEATWGVGPFTHGWPAVTIQVAPQVPANRTIDLANANGNLYITAPRSARAQLYYLYIVDCDLGGGVGQASTNGYWQQISSTVLAEPSCPGTQERWQFSISAPGFAIAAGELDGP